MSNSQLWLRAWRILIADENDKEALNVSDLHCKFRFKYAMQTENWGTIEIYNLDRETEDYIIAHGNRIIVEAGYMGRPDGKGENNGPSSYGVIFDGEIIYPARRYENNTDYVLTLTCVDGLTNYLRKNFIAKTMYKNRNQRQLLGDVCNFSTRTIPIYKVSNGLSEAKLPRGKVFFGSPEKYINGISAGNNARAYFQNGALVVDKLTDTDDEEALVVTPQTGLVGSPTQTQDGANFRLLLNPAVRMRMFLQLQKVTMTERSAGPMQPQIPIDDQWIYRVISYTHIGDTRGNDWYTDIVGVTRAGRGSIAAMLQNSAQNPNSI